MEQSSLSVEVHFIGNHIAADGASCVYRGSEAGQIRLEDRHVPLVVYRNVWVKELVVIRLAVNAAAFVDGLSAEEYESRRKVSLVKREILIPEILCLDRRSRQCKIERQE